MKSTDAGERFRSDLRLGKLAEDAVARTLARFSDGPIEQSDGNVASHDLTVGGRAIEVKCDFASARTGRVAVELATSGRPSGLGAPAAGVVVYVLPQFGAGFLISRDTLLEIARRCPRKKGGDFGTQLLALVPVALLREHATALALGEDDARRLGDAAARRGRRP